MKYDLITEEVQDIQGKSIHKPNLFMWSHRRFYILNKYLSLMTGKGCAWESLSARPTAIHLSKVMDKRNYCDILCALYWFLHLLWQNYKKLPTESSRLRVDLGLSACFTATILEYCPKYSYTQIYSVKGCRGQRFFPVLIPTSSYLRCYTTSDSDRKIVCKHLGKIISTKSKRRAGQWLSFFRAIQILQQPGIYFVCVLLQCTPLCFLPKERSQDSWNIWQRFFITVSSTF